MKKYFDPLLHWWWLILACTVVAGVACYLSVREMPPVYEVHATLIVGRTMNNPNPSSGEFYLEQQLANVYATMGSQGQVVEATMNGLGLAELPDFYISPVPNAPMIDIAVSDTDPARAQAVANELADQLVNIGPASSNKQLGQRREFIDEQLDLLQEEIVKTDESIAEANQKLAASNSAREIEDNQALINALEEKKTSLQISFTNLLANTEQGATNTLTVAQYAPLPMEPVGPNKALYIALATVFGLFLSVGGAYLVDLLDTRVKSREEISQLLQTPILGEVPNFPKQDSGIYTAKNPRSPITDAFRSLRTNLEFLSINHPLRTILITGPDSSGGKSTIASNLALLFAKGGKKVILLDADMRRPNLHNLLGTTSDPGISDVCVGRTDLYSALHSWGTMEQPDDNQRQFLSKDNDLLRILPAGTIPPNPAELLSSPRFDQVLADLKEQADLIIIDSPPIFLPDTTTLFPKVDGILMVIQSGRTSKSSIMLIKEQISRSGARLLGITINRSKTSTPFYQRYETETDQSAASEKRRLNIRLPEMKMSRKSDVHKTLE